MRSKGRPKISTEQPFLRVLEKLSMAYFFGPTVVTGTDKYTSELFRRSKIHLQNQ